jgi:TatD DNase family protein
MYLVDVHAHLDHPQFKEDLKEVLLRAKKAGIVAVITQGLTHETNSALLDLAKRDSSIKVAFGLYPSFMPEVKAELFPEETLLKSKVSADETLSAIERHKHDIVAIGEVGLDFKESVDPEARAIQVEIFRKVVRLAKKLRKPLIIHSRGAEREVIDILEQEQYFRADMHCFSGSKKLIERGAKMGLMFSIPTSVVRNPQFQLMAQLLPVGNILTETDAPYQGPCKGERNEPANIREAVLKIAEIKKMDPEECANAIYFNYQKLFL